MKNILLFICLVLSFSSFANDEALLKQKQIKKTIDDQIKRHSSSPQWSPESNSLLPLAVNKAIDIAIEWGRNKWPLASGIKVLEIKLGVAVGNDEGVWWDYQVYVVPEPYIDNIIKKIGGEIVITMDGIVDKYREVGTNNFVLTSR